MNSVTNTDPEIDSSVDNSITRNGEIAALAYKLWVERGCPAGSAEEDWFLAEALLANQYVSAAAA